MGRQEGFFLLARKEGYLQVSGVDIHGCQVLSRQAFRQAISRVHENDLRADHKIKWCK